jgi:hypothetical protein
MYPLSMLHEIQIFPKKPKNTKLAQKAKKINKSQKSQICQKSQKKIVFFGEKIVFFGEKKNGTRLHKDYINREYMTQSR